MASNDLFSFLDNPGDENDEDMDVGVQNPTESLQKRKAEDNEPDQPVEDTMAEDVTPALKKARLSSPKPVVLDDFETEAKREVAASAGLTGAAETDSRLELKHQVIIIRCVLCR